MFSSTLDGTFQKSLLSIVDHHRRRLLLCGRRRIKFHDSMVISSPLRRECECEKKFFFLSFYVANAEKKINTSDVSASHHLWLLWLTFNNCQRVCGEIQISSRKGKRRAKNFKVKCRRRFSLSLLRLFLMPVFPHFQLARIHYKFFFCFTLHSRLSRTTRTRSRIHLHAKWVKYRKKKCWK